MYNQANLMYILTAEVQGVREILFKRKICRITTEWKLFQFYFFSFFFFLSLYQIHSTFLKN